MSKGYVRKEVKYNEPSVVFIWSMNDNKCFYGINYMMSHIGMRISVFPNKVLELKEEENFMYF